MDNTLVIVLLLISLLPILSCSLPLIKFQVLLTARAKVVVFIPPPVDPGDAPIIRGPPRVPVRMVRRAYPPVGGTSRIPIRLGGGAGRRGEILPGTIPGHGQGWACAICHQDEQVGRLDPNPSPRINPGAPSSKANGRMSAALGSLTGPTARKGITSLVDQAIVSGANFFAGVAVGRSCSKEELGLYALGFSVVVFLLNLQNTLIALPYTVHSPRLSGEDLKSFTSSSLLHQLGYSASTAGVLFLAGWLLSAGHGPAGMPAVLWALAIGIPFLLLREYSRQMSFAWLRVQSALLVDLSVATIYLGGLYYLARQGELSAARAFYLSGAACALVASVWFLLKRGNFSFVSAHAVKDFRRNWELARWPLAAGIANLAAIQLYPWFLTVFHGTEATGVLSACLGTVFLANPFIIGMGNFLGPKIMHAHARGGTEAARDIVTKGTLAIFVVLGPFCLCMIFFGDFFLRTIYGGKYAGNAGLVSLLAVGQFVDVITLPMVPASFVLGRPDAVFRSYFAALLVTGTAGLCLVKYFGTIGVACGLIAAGATASLYRWRVYQSALRTVPAGSDL